MPRSKRAPLTEADLADKPARQRSVLTGQHRNDAEAQRIRGMLDTVQTHFRVGRHGEAQRVVRLLVDRLDALVPVLTRGAPATYAPVHATPDGDTRTPADAVRVASDNVRRAIGAGDVDRAREYLGILRTLAGA